MVSQEGDRRLFQRAEKQSAPSFLSRSEFRSLTSAPKVGFIGSPLEALGLGLRLVMEGKHPMSKQRQQSLCAGIIRESGRSKTRCVYGALHYFPGW
jgi:hypothetical protein